MTSRRWSGTGTVAVCVAGPCRTAAPWVPVTAWKSVVFPLYGNPIIPSFIHASRGGAFVWLVFARGSW